MSEKRGRDDDARKDKAPDGTGVHGAPNDESAAGQSSATGWDMDKTKPGGSPSTDEIKPDDKQDSSSTSTASPGVGVGKQAGSTPSRR